MKKVTALLLCLILACTLAACGCRHEWAEASCTAAQSCSNCGETRGEPLGHQWQEASCEAAKTCTACGLSEGEALGHEWSEACCETAKTCKRCFLTEGEPLGHLWTSAASCTEEIICTVCNAASGEFGNHMDIEAIGNESNGDVWFICKCGQEVTISADALMLRLLQGNWTLRVIQKADGYYRPAPDTNWMEATWLEFPSDEEPIGYEAGESDTVAKILIPQKLEAFKKVTLTMYTGGPEIPALSCNAISDYGANQYLSTPLILTIGNRDYAPEDYTDEAFLEASINGQIMTLWRMNTDGTYIYYPGAE